MARLSSYALVGLMVGALLESGCGRDRDPVPLQPAPPLSLELADGGSQPTRRERKPGFIGVVTAQDSSEVSSKVGGELAAVHVRLGDKVKAGALIATIDDRHIREELAIATAAARSARARISQARVDVDEAREQLTIEKRAFVEGTTSRKSVVEAEFRLKKAQAASARTRADLGEQHARVSQLRRRRGDAKVTAPFAGTVSSRHLDPGAMVTPGQPIVRLITSQELWVKFAVPGVADVKLTVDDEVSVRIESISATLSATIRQIAPELEPSSQMIIVHADLDIPDELEAQIQSGLVARVTVVKSEESVPDADAAVPAPEGQP